MRSLPDPDAIVKTKLHHPAANTIALATIAAVADQFHVIDRVDWSLDTDANAVETLTIAINAVTVWKVDIYDGWTGHGFVEFPHGLYTTVVNQAATVTLSSNGGATGKVNVVYR